MACTSCRTRKLRCSRERPMCTNCRLYSAVCDYSPPRVPEPRARRAKAATTSAAVRGNVPIAPAPGPSLSSASTLTFAPAFDAFASSAFSQAQDPWSTAGLAPHLSDDVSWLATNPFAMPMQQASLPVPEFEPAPPPLITPAVHEVDIEALLSRLDTPAVTQSAGTVGTEGEIICESPETAPLPPLSRSDPSTPDTTTSSSSSSSRTLNGANLSEGLLRIHALVPLLPLELGQLLLELGEGLKPRMEQIHGTLLEEQRRPAVFAALSLLALVSATEPGALNNILSVSHERAFNEAQQLAIPAYLAAVSGEDAPTKGKRKPKDAADLAWTDPHALTAAGLVFLSVRCVCTLGWSKPAQAFLKLAMAIVKKLPERSVVRAWFARIIFLWGLGINLAATPFGPKSLQRVTLSQFEEDIRRLHFSLQLGAERHSLNEEDENNDPASTGVVLLATRLPFFVSDPDAIIFDSVVALAIDLTSSSTMSPASSPEAMDVDNSAVDTAAADAHALLRIHNWFTSLPSELTLGSINLVCPLDEWVQPPPVASYTQPAGDQTRQAVSHIARMLYYALIVKFCGRDAHAKAYWLDKQGVSTTTMGYLRTGTSTSSQPLSLPNIAQRLAAPTTTSTVTPGPQPTATVRETSLRAAMPNLIEASDWFLHTRHFWLWPFAEQALVFVESGLLGRLEATFPARSAGPSTVSAVPTTTATSPSFSLEEATSGDQASAPADSTSPLAPSDDPHEASLRSIIAHAALAAPDAPLHGVLRMIQVFLFEALQALTLHAPGHLKSVSELLTVVSAATSGNDGGNQLAGGKKAQVLGGWVRRGRVRGSD